MVYWVLMGFTWTLLGFTGSNQGLPSFTGFYRVLLGFNGFYLVLPGFTGFYRVFLLYLPFKAFRHDRKSRVTGFYRVLPTQGEPKKKEKEINKKLRAPKIKIKIKIRQQKEKEMKVNRNDCHLASLFSALDFFSFHAVAWQKKRNFLFFFFFGLIFFFSFFFAAAPVIRRVNVLGPNSPNEKCYRVSFFFTEFFFSFFTSTPLARFLMRKQLMQIHFYF